MGNLTLAEGYLPELLKKEGVFEKIDDRFMDPGNGWTGVLCPDCDHQDDMFEHLRKKCGRMQPLALNGGALLMAKHLPTFGDFSKGFKVGLIETWTSVMLCLYGVLAGWVLRYQIHQTYKMKGILKVFLLAHLPCGAARALKLDVVGVLDSLVQAKAILKSDNRKLQADNSKFEVKCLLHVAWPDGKKQTFFISREKWLRVRNRYAEMDESTVLSLLGKTD